MAEWTSAAIGFAGSIIGAVSASGVAWLSWRHSEKVRKSQIRLEKLERLYEALEKMHQYYIEMHCVMSGHLAIGTEIELPKAKVPVSEMRMLAGIYAKEVEAQVFDALSMITEYGDFLVDAASLKFAPENNAKRKALLEKSVELSERLQRVMHVAMDATANLAQREMS